jgi:hypothetical protein
MSPDSRTSDNALRPVGRMIKIVLEDAVNCYVRNMHRTNRGAVVEFREVQEWFSSKDSRELFAFKNICQVLGIDAGWMRRGLRAAEPGSKSKTRDTSRRRKGDKIVRRRSDKLVRRYSEASLQISKAYAAAIFEQSSTAVRT